MTQFIVPTADDTDGNWLNNNENNTDLYSYVDEGIIGGTADDNTWISGTSSASTVKLKLDNVNGTPQGTGTFKMRLNSDGEFISYSPILLEGSTERWKPFPDSQSFSNSSFDIVNFTIEEASGDNITDWDNLYVSVSNDAGDLFKISEIEFEFSGEPAGPPPAPIEFIVFSSGCRSDLRGMVDIRG